MRLAVWCWLNCGESEKAGQQHQPLRPVLSKVLKQVSEADLWGPHSNLCTPSSAFHPAPINSLGMGKLVFSAFIPSLPKTPFTFHHINTPLARVYQPAVLIIIISPCHSFFCFFEDFFLDLFLEGGERKEKERERNIDVQEKHQLAASCTPSTGDLACNPGICPDWELNQWPFGSEAGTQSTEPQHPGPPAILIFTKDSWLLTRASHQHGKTRATVSVKRYSFN